MKDEGFIHEVFFSFQGEGIHVGRLQLFIRLAGCNLGCRYCDSVPAQTHPKKFSIEGGAVSNPVAAKDLFNRVRGLIEGVKSLHAISITGGEPLEQPAFLESLLRLRPSWGVPVYLETNGLHPDEAESIFPLVDIISLDIKLPSLCAEDDFLALYDKTLPAASGRELFCKVVVADGMDRIEFGRAVDLIARFDPGVTLVIQPVSPLGGCVPPAPMLLGELHSEASERLRDVRVIPQCHPLMGIP